MQRRGSESGGKVGWGLSNSLGRHTGLPVRVSSAAELIQSALMSNMIAWREKCDHRRVRWTSIKQQKQKKYKRHLTQDI